MSRSTRSRRGEDVTQIQDDPEAILRSHRQSTRAAGGGRRRSNTRGLSLPPTQAAASPRSGDGEQAEQNATSESIAAEGRGVSKGEEELNSVSAAQSALPNDEKPSTSPRTGQPPSGPSQQIHSSNTHPAAGNETGASSQTTAANAPTGANGDEGGSTKALESNPTGNDQANTNGRYDLNDEDKEDSDPKRHGQDSRVSAPAGDQEGGEQPPATACERLNTGLTAAATHIANAPPLHAENDFMRGRDLPIETLHLAIASVTEAISERGHVRFSLIDRIGEDQMAARPGQTLFWPQHRDRDGRGGRGHFSLFTVYWNSDESRFVLEHRDSYASLRNGDSVRDSWQIVRRALATPGGEFKWDRLNPGALPHEPPFATGQYNQTQSWTCGLFTIINAWIHALGLPRSQIDPPRTPRIGACVNAACTLVRYAMQGHVGSAIIRNFLECYGFIEAGAQVEDNRTFERTLPLPSPNSLVQRVARVRFEAGLSEGDPSIDEMIRVIESFGEEVNLAAFKTKDKFVEAYYLALDAQDGVAARDGIPDEAMARRAQEEEYSRDLTPEPPNPINGQPQGGEVPAQQQDNARMQGANSAPEQRPPASTAPEQQTAGQRVREAAGPALGQQAAGERQQPGTQAQANGGEQDNTIELQGAYINPAVVLPGLQETLNSSPNDGNNHAADTQPPVTMQNQPPPPPGQDQAADEEADRREEEEAERRRQRAYDLLRPPDDPFKPGAPLHPPSATVQRALDAGESELSMLIAPYSNLPRHQNLRERFGLPDLTNAFDGTSTNRPQAQTQTQQQGQQQGEQQQEQQQQSGPPTTAPEGEVPQQDQNGTNQAHSRAGPDNEPPQAPAAGQSTIPGLQSTIPNGTGAAPGQQAPDSQQAEGTNADQAAAAASGTREASQESQSSLRSAEYYERLEEQEEAARQERERERELEQRREEFEGETQARRQRTEGETENEEGADGDGEDGGLDSLFEDDSGTERGGGDDIE